MSIFHDQASLMQRARQQLQEKTLTAAETQKREEIVKSMKKSAGDFEKRYPGRGKEVMYATATKQAKKVAEDIEKVEEVKLSYVAPGQVRYGKDDEGNVKLSKKNLKKKAGKALRTLIGGGKDRGSIRIRFGEETQIDEIAPLVAAGLLAAPVVAGAAAGHFMKKAVEKGQQNPNRRLVTGGTVGDLQRARSESIEITNQMIDEGKADKKLPEHERSAARLKRYDNPSGALALGGGQQRARRAEHEERRGVKKEEVISHLIDNGFAETEQNALKIMENMGESWAQEIITELNRLEREQGKESGGNPDKAYQHVKKMIRGMEGKPEGQRKKVPGKKPPAAGEYGAPRSPAQKVAMRRAAKKRSDEMQSSRYD
ncbi:hypothetical protein [Synechococcus phage DSL-LC02]|nr:hypothetical protein [Synechococcus phage DSL-LC02]